MAYEIEMKAWVDDWPAVERALRDRCTFERSFRKDDRYFAPPDGEGLFRVRIDGRPAARGEGSARRAYVTYKEKEVRDGVEVNLEREFGVDDAEAFVEFVTSFRCRETFAKVKEGLHFSHDGLTVELVHVEGLGDFLEVECVLADDGGGAGPDGGGHDETAERIRALVRELGVDDERIEARPYMKLLRERRGRA
ncbi:MAG: hypothetical protein ACOC2D_13830 [Spirochaetota bacterium]